jgi:flagellar protein FliT
MTVQELISINNELLSILDQTTQNNRGESIQSLNELLAKREVVLKQLDFNSVKTDQALKQQLLADETEIRKNMEHLLSDIKMDIKMLNKKRSMGGTYINPYKNLYINGAFFDKKK